jgi:hypothetical protein
MPKATLAESVSHSIYGLAAEGENRAVGDVGAVQHTIRQRIAEGEQRVECCRMEAVQHLLEEIEHLAAATVPRGFPAQDRLPDLTCQTRISG